MNRDINYRYKRIMIIFGIILAGTFFIDLTFYFLCNNSIEEFYALLVLGTIIALMLFLFLYHLINEFFYKNSIKDKVSTIFKMLPIVIILAVSISRTIRDYKDIPYIVDGQYKVIVEKCTYYYINLNRPPHLEITIGGIDFNVSLKYENLIKKGEIYRVEYLPNSKRVMNIYSEVLRNN